MNPTSTSVTPRARRARPLGAAPVAVAILYPKVGNVLRVPLRRTATGGRRGCAQHPERQFIVWFNRMAAARPGFPAQIRSILLITGQPLCASCHRALATYLSRYYLADKLRLQTTGRRACGCGDACGCDRLAATAQPKGIAHGLTLLDALLHDALTGSAAQYLNQGFSAPPWAWQANDDELNGEVDLDRHEGKIGGLTSGGHTLKKHVNGNTDTVFASRKIAEDLIGRALDNAQVKRVIANWLKGTADAQVEIKYSFPNTVIGKTRGNKANGILIIMIRNAAIQPEGYQILTAYPTIIPPNARPVSISIRAVGLTTEI